MSLAVEPKQVVVLASEPSGEEIRQQVIRISGSPAFRNAPLLQRFLEFITSRTEEKHSEDLNEYTIATQVFGRPQDFDPASDTIVRTQAYRLRTKLKEYYENEGKSDPLTIEIPKGHYVPTFSSRAEKNEAEKTVDLHLNSVLPQPDIDAAKPRWSRRFFISAALFCAVVVFAGGLYMGSRWTTTPVTITSPKLPQPVNQFWGSLVNGNDIILAYTNSVFFETETGDLLRFRGGAVADRGARAGKETARATALNPSLVERAGPLYYEDGYTGTGEVLAVHRLTRVLAALGASVIVKRSRLVTVDDLRNHDVIFLGSPFENQVLGDMHLPQRFAFQQPQEPPLLWRGSILDKKATGSEPASYQLERDPQEQIIRSDYALFNVLPGPVAGRRIIILAGLTTSGTQGAAEFATSEAGLLKILEILGSGSNGHKEFPPYFESLVRVEAAKGLDAITVKYVTASKVEASE